MSLFLGHIHYWLFKKIQLLEELEVSVLNNIPSPLKEDISSKALSFGEFLPNSDLADLIDESNIHGWLQHRISIAEQQSAFIFTTIKNNSHTDIILDQVKIQASKCGLTKDVASASEAYNLLNDFVLSGMPCDRINVITEESETSLTWKKDTCIHKENFLKGSGELDLMYMINDEWASTFFKTLGYSYSTQRNGEKSIHTISKI